MLVTSQMIWDELQEQKRILMRILDKEVQFSIEEISLNKASKLLHLGSKRIIEEVERGNLSAIIYYDKTGKKRYRFRIADIREFQKLSANPATVDEDDETVDELGKRIFGWIWQINIYSTYNNKKVLG